VGKASDKSFVRDSSGAPMYLQRVKANVAAEERLIADRLGFNRNLDGAPPGCVLLPDCERLDTLARLKKKQEELELQHRRLPLKIETVGQKQRAEELEKELKTVEQGISSFSQPKVFIRV